MRNLKRALSLALAAVMVLGKDEIDHAEAVQVMVALNVIAGKEDGSFYDPTGTLTRAEMAKIVSYVMNGGVEPVMAIKPVPTYSDIDGHWAESYIEYCTTPTSTATGQRATLSTAPAWASLPATGLASLTLRGP